MRGSLNFFNSDDQKRVAALSITNEENENFKSTEEDLKKLIIIKKSGQINKRVFQSLSHPIYHEFNILSLNYFK